MKNARGMFLRHTASLARSNCYVFSGTSIENSFRKESKVKLKFTVGSVIFGGLLVLGSSGARF